MCGQWSPSHFNKLQGSLAICIAFSILNLPNAVCDEYISDTGETAMVYRIHFTIGDK